VTFISAPLALFPSTPGGRFDRLKGKDLEVVKGNCWIGKAFGSSEGELFGGNVLWSSKRGLFGLGKPLELAEKGID
jgi:hypothetical protein